MLLLDDAPCKIWNLSMLGFLCHAIENQSQGLALYLLLEPGSAASSLKHSDAGPHLDFI
jgi:hypothetical protein